MSGSYFNTCPDTECYSGSICNGIGSKLQVNRTLTSSVNRTLDISLLI